MEYHLLQPGDLALLRAMLSLFGRAFDDAATYDSAPPSDDYFARLLASPAFLAIAALHEGEIAGGLTAYILPKPEQPRSEAYLYDLAVDEPFRRCGVATALINALRAAAAHRGASAIYVQADRSDAPAVALYSRLAVAREVLHFDLPSTDNS